MNVDVYRYRDYEVVVPTGVDLKTLNGQAEIIASKLTSSMMQKTNVELNSLYKGELLGKVKKQIEENGMGLSTMTFLFTESSVPNPKNLP